VKISYRRLVKAAACDEQRFAFEELFGRNRAVEVTLELCLKYADVFRWQWASSHLLSAEAHDVFRNLYYPARASLFSAEIEARKIHENELETFVAFPGRPTPQENYAARIVEASCIYDKTCAEAFYKASLVSTRNSNSEYK
jgi:hypothetical protein